MDHDKIAIILTRLNARVQSKNDSLAEAASDLIRDLRTECDNHATKIVDLEEKAEAVPEMVAALEDIIKHMDDNGMQNWPVAKKARAALQKVRP